MKEDIKKAWLDALRSGEYGQCDGALSDGESFCCLGVLCDLHQKMTGNGVWTRYEDEDGTDWVSYKTEKETEKETLPASVTDWAGLYYNNPEVGEYTKNNATLSTLAELNDYGYTFEEIADIIEEKL